jgi:hypothetical protein
MARPAREFREAPELKELAGQIIEKYTDFFPQLSLNDVYFAFCESDSKENYKPIIMGNVANPLMQKICKQKYQIAFYRDMWVDWSDEKQIIMLFKALYSIDPEVDGSLRKNDVSDYYIILSTFGLDWSTLDEGLPNLLTQTVVFKTPVAPNKADEEDEEDEGPKMAPTIQSIVEEQEMLARAQQGIDDRRA